MPNTRIAGAIVLAICVSVILLALFSKFSFFYFWLDDYNNLWWVQRTPYLDLFRHMVNPASDYHRPLGMLVYKIHFDLFHLEPLPYRITVFLLHTLNVLLVYLVLRKMIGSGYAAGFGALFFSYQVAFWHIFWQFGTIFELLAGAFFFLGILTFLRHGHGWQGMLSATVIFVLAMRSKEMAVTLPIAWLLYDVVVNVRRGSWKRFFLPAAIAGWFVYWKVAIMGQSNPSMPYSMEFSPAAIFHGFGWYLNALGGGEWSPSAWIVPLILVIGAIGFTRNRMALFFLLYVGLTFLPVIFLVNHRHDFFWYIPMLGVCGLLAVTVKAAHARLSPMLAPRYLPATQAAVLIVAACLHWSVQNYMSRHRYNWGMEVATESRQFVQDVQSRPEPAPGETLYFTFMPRFFSENIVMQAVQVTLRRTDIDVRVATDPNTFN